MKRLASLRPFITAAMTFAVFTSLSARAVDSPIAFESARVTLAGTSNLHDWSASSARARIVKATIAPCTGTDPWDGVLAPNAIEAFEVAVPVKTLASDKDGLDKNMFKALKADQYPDVIFAMKALDLGVAGKGKAPGVLTIAGVSRDVVFTVTTRRAGATLNVSGTLDLLMTDYGIAPPKAMMGMLKTDPKVTVSFDVVLGIS
jgi:polyisoprenoid-binding protein YceI